MALVELLRKSGDGDFPRSAAEAVPRILMEADVEGLIGAGRHARGIARIGQAHRGVARLQRKPLVDAATSR